MSLFDKLGSTPPRADMRQELVNIKSDPVGYIKSRGKSIPDGMTDPGQIARYLLQSGQVGNNTFQSAIQLINGMRK